MLSLIRLVVNHRKHSLHSIASSALFTCKVAATKLLFERQNMAFSNGSDIPRTISRLKEDVKNGKLVQDGIHKAIAMHPLAVAIVDTPVFKRLKSINCLAEAHEVYPCGIHTRFEHSLGVYHLALQFALELVEGNIKLCQEAFVTYQDVLCVALAGLLHDLGHGPMSHSYEALLRQHGTEFHHEGMSVKLIDDLFSIGKIRDCADKYGLRLNDAGNDLDFMKELINGPLDRKRYSSRPPSKFFLFEIVANKRTNIDVDRWDYFKRDSRACGVKINFDYKRLLKNARVMKLPGTPDDPEWRTCVAFPRKDVGTAWELFTTRRQLHRKIYQHRVVKITDQMKLDALTSLKDEFTIFVSEPKNPSATRKFSLFNAHEDIRAYKKLDDTVLGEIRRSTNPKYAVAQKLFDRVDERDLYYVFAKLTTRDDATYAHVLKTPQRGLQKAFMDETNTVTETYRESLRKNMLNIVRQCLRDDSSAPTIADDDVKSLVLKLDYGGVNNAEHPLKSVVLFHKGALDTPIPFHEDLLLGHASMPASFVTAIDLLAVKPSLHAVSLETKLRIAAALRKWWTDWTKEGAEGYTIGKLYCFEAPDCPELAECDDDDGDSDGDVSMSPDDAAGSTSAAAESSGPLTSPNKKRGYDSEENVASPETSTVVTPQSSPEK